MPFAEYYSLFQRGPDRFLIHPFSARSEVLRFLKNDASVDVIVIGDSCIAVGLAHQLALQQLVTVLLTSNDFGTEATLVPFFSSTPWAQSAYKHPFHLVRGTRSRAPHARFSTPIFIDEKQQLVPGYGYNARKVFFDILRAARSEGVFAITQLKVEAGFRVGERSMVKIFDERLHERFDLKAKIIINASCRPSFLMSQLLPHRPVIQVEEIGLIPFLSLPGEGLLFSPDGGGVIFIEGSPNESALALEQRARSVVSFGRVIGEGKAFQRKKSEWEIASGMLVPGEGGVFEEISAGLTKINRYFPEHQLRWLPRNLPSLAIDVSEIAHSLRDRGGDDFQEFCDRELIFDADGFERRFSG